MKKLLYIILLLPLWVNAQTNGTIQKTSSTGTIRGSFGSLGLDTLPRVTGALVNGYILKYHAATNKWYASPDPTYPGLQDSLNTRVKKTGDTMIGTLNGTSAAFSGNGSFGTSSGNLEVGYSTFQNIYKLDVNGTGRFTSTLTANSFVKTGGTSTQALMADGSVYALQDSLTKKANRTFDNVASGAIPILKLASTTTVGRNFLNLTNPSAITFPRINADNSVSALDAATFRTAIGAGTGGGTITGSGTTNYIPKLTGGTALGNSLIYDNGSAISIGTTSPLSTIKFQVTGNTSSGNSIGYYEQLGMGSGLTVTTGGSSGSDYILSLRSAGVDRLRVGDNGFVGIGTTSVTPLGVLGTVNDTRIEMGNTGTNDAYTQAYDRVAGVYRPYIFASDNFQFKTGASSTAGLTIESNQNTTIHSLAGTGTRMVVADNTGLISTQAIPGGGGGSVTGVAVATANGLGGTSDGATVVPTLTLTTNVTGMVKANGSAFSAAVSNTDYLPVNNPTTTGTLTAATISASGNTSSLGFIVPQTGGSFYEAGSTNGVAVYGSTAGGGNANSVIITTTNLKATPLAGIGDRVVVANSTGGMTATTTLSSLAPLASPSLTGNPTAPTQTAGDNSTKIATTAYVDGAIVAKTNRILKDWYTDANNVSSTPTDLYDYTVPANTLANNGDKLHFRISGIYASSADIKTITVYFGSSNVALSPAPLSVASEWIIEGTIIRNTSTTYRMDINNNIGTTSVAESNIIGSVTNYTGTNVFKITGTGGASADITAQMGYLEFKPAAL